MYEARLSKMIHRAKCVASVSILFSNESYLLFFVFLSQRGHINVVSSCDITKDERKFATTSWDKNICIWDIATGSYR